MTIFELLKQLKKSHWYQIPSDIYGQASRSVDYYQACKDLTELRNYWGKQDVKTTFKMADPIEMPVWCPVELKMLIKPLVRITMNNEKIDNFKV